MELLLRMVKWSVLAGGVTLLLLLLKGPLDKRYSAKWRYWLWLVLAAVLLLAPVPWGALLPEGAASAVETPVTIQVPQTTIVVGQGGVSLTTREELEESLLTAAPAVDSNAAEEPQGPTRPETARLPLETVLTGLWLGGALALLLWRLGGSWTFARKVRRWSREPREETAALCAGIRKEMGVERKVSLAVCAAVDSPMVVGLFRPRLLLPREDYSPRELAFIFRHELTHICRRDLWYKLVLLLAQTIYWWNPLVWLMARQAEADIELTCDDAVVAGRSGEDRRAYSETLLSSLHRQKGLARAALSTHFYGGAEIMKQRFRNILGSSARRWGGAALACVLLLVAAVGCTVGVSAAVAGKPLGDEELEAWQEKLSDTTYNGFVAGLYSDVSRLPVGQVFYNGAGVDHEMTEAERAAVLEAMGGDPDCPIVAVTTQAADDFLRENTGLGLDQIAGGFGSMWIYLPEYDSYYLAHGDTNYVSVTVTSGIRRGNTIELTIERPDDVPGITEMILTITDGKIQSFTTPLYTAVETMAWQLMEDQAAEYESAREDGPTFVDRYVSDLWCSASFSLDGTSYSVWNVSYRLLPEDLSKVVLAGGMDLENGWLTEAASMGSPVLIVSVDEKGNITLEEETWAYALWREDGFTWEEYITCKIHMGMDLTYKLGGWPELTSPFIIDMLEGHNTWAMSWDSCAVAYLEDCQVSPGTFTQVREFEQRSDSECDKSLLIRCDSEEGAVYLLLCHINYPVPAWDDTASFWQVCGEVWENGATQATAVQEHVLYQRAVDFGGSHIGTIYLSGWQGNDCGGVSSVQVLWDDGSGTIFYTRDAIEAQWGQDSRDYFTDASSYVATEDGYAFDGGLKLLDVNFDGYLDIGLQAWRDAGGAWYEYFWLFDPETAQFQYAFCLREVGTDPETEEVISAYTEDGTSGEERVPCEDRYVWDEAGNLTLSRRLEGAAGTEGKATYSLVNGVCTILGEYDDRTRLEWHLPSEVYPEGWLYVANPYFLGDSFRDMVMEGSARWTDGDRESLQVRLVENSSLNIGGTVDGPSRIFTVDIAAGKVLQEERFDYHGEAPIPLTEEELVRVAGLLAGVMGEAEAWVEERSASAPESMAWTEYTLADGIPLTTGELAGFEELFSGYDPDNYDSYLYNGLLHFPFAGPEDAGYCLDLLFYDAGNFTASGQRVEEVRSEEEKADLRAAGVPIDNYEVQKIPRAQAQADLARLFGLTEAEAAKLLEEAAVKPGYLYLEEYDAYYSVHTDTWWKEYTFTSGFFYGDGICVLDYKTPFIADFSRKPPEERGYWSDAAMQLTLRQEDGSWVAVSNLGLSA